MTYEQINPEELGEPRGWTNGMLAPVGGRILFVAGQDAAEPQGVVTEDDFVEQFSIALGKAVTVVREAGGGPEDVGRLTVFVADVAEYRARRGELKEVYRAYMGRHYPAMALVQAAGFVDPRAKVEIEATAVIQDYSAPGFESTRDPGPAAGEGG
ncbi:MAG TPA: RidA family protein [Longimicrobiales bacterium]|nr:RidA family protein [Longimicrobiales bacterium]